MMIHRRDFAVGIGFLLFSVGVYLLATGNISKNNPSGMYSDKDKKKHEDFIVAGAILILIAVLLLISVFR